MRAFSRLFRLFVNSQIKVSSLFDRALPQKFRIDGYRDFSSSIIPKYLHDQLIIYDIGGGKNPYLTVDLKARLNRNIIVIGIDIDEKELNSAPEGIYDKTIAADITKYRGERNGDLVICLALLEHVNDIDAALRGICSCLKGGGYCAIFVPSKNAIYAKINKILPEGLKKMILYSLFPHTRALQGFHAYYDRCTPRDIKYLVHLLGFEVVEERYYYISSYFRFFFPLFILWRIYFLTFYLIAREQAAETFGIVLRKID